MTSIFDKEVEKYLGKCQEPPGCGRSATKRPATACSFFPTEPTTPKKRDSEYRPKTPRSCRSARKRTPHSLKTPTKTPTESDRFIPPRGSMNFSSSHYKIMHGWLNHENEVSSSTNTESKRNYKTVMSENINRVLSECNTPKILQYQSKVATPIKSTSSSIKNVVTPSPSKISRKISLIPEKILDAPNYIDDYYLNLLHWSSSENLIAVALDDSVYIWTPSSGAIDCLCTLNGPQSYVSSLQWIGKGCQLAVGVSNGNVQLWDTDKKKCLRIMDGHIARVSSLSWNSYVLSSGGRTGIIHNHDVRIAQHCVNQFTSHSQEICGLEWSSTGRYLACGANDNKVTIWDWNQVSDTASTRTNPVHVFSEHKAAVKALAWCPWQHHVLASGGGAADKCIRFWNINSGTCLNTIATSSQVSSLLWNETYKELLSSHGYPNNQLSIWNYPSMFKKADLAGHTGRVLQVTMSPDQTRVMSSAGDETLRLWNCFELSKEKRKEKSASKKLWRNVLTPAIR